MKIMYSLMLVMCVLIFAMLVGCCMSSKAQKGAYGEKVAWYFQFFSPADDLYDPLVLMPISLMGETSYDFEYTHKYSGLHDFSFLLPKMGEMEGYDKKVGDFDIFVGISSDKFNVVSKEISGHELFMSFSRLSDEGIILFRYSLPKDVSINDMLHCHVVIRNPGPVFIDKYGDPTLMIKKTSTE